MNSKLVWQKGVSYGSCGRLGAHAAGFEPAENGYLTCVVNGPQFILIGPERQVIGSLQLPPRYDLDERTHDWTLRVSHYTAPAQDGFPAVELNVLGSVLSPAITFASTHDRMFRWRWQVRSSPWSILYPAADAAAVSAYHDGLPAAFGPRSGRWLITFSAASKLNVPLLWVFHGQPPRQMQVTTYEYMDLHFTRPFERVSIMPLFGVAEVDHELLKRLASGKDLSAMRAWADYWAAALIGLPDQVDEAFAIDRHAGLVHVRDVGRRIDAKKPACCPIPPFLAAACASSYPIKIDSPSLAAPPRLGCRTKEQGQDAHATARPGDLPTQYGPYRLVRGGTLEYTMPLCPYLDTVLSPVRVRGDRRADGLTRKLRAYFKDPKWTYGGDGTYDPDSLLDILHNLRVLSWATWSIDDSQRAAAGREILRDFENLFNERAYLFYREPVTGRRFARDRAIFDWCGPVTYDMDWYSGMNLAGLWAGVYFGLIPLELVRRRWPLVRQIEAYFEIFQDWATLVPWTDMRGELLNIDCCRHGIQGMIGFARLARQLGMTEQADRAACIASRYVAFLAAEHQLPDLWRELGVPTSARKGQSGSMTLGFTGLHERDGRPFVCTSANKAPYSLSPLNPEHMLFLREHGPLAKLREYESKALAHDVPGWDTQPAKVYFDKQPPGSIEHNAGAYHFYMVDPHLFLRMLVLDWPSKKAVGRVKELSGQVLATMLVADAPKVLSPAGVEFAGVEWDAKRKVLTIRARASRPMAATWQVLHPNKPKSVIGPAGLTHRFESNRLTISAKFHGEVLLQVGFA